VHFLKITLKLVLSNPFTSIWKLFSTLISKIDSPAKEGEAILYYEINNISSNRARKYWRKNKILVEMT
jgi:hypothetical protein